MAALLNLSLWHVNIMLCICDNTGIVTQKRKEMLIGSKAEFEIKQITIAFLSDKILYYKNYSKLNLY